MGGRDTRNSSLAVLWLYGVLAITTVTTRKTYADNTNPGLDSTELFIIACCMSCALILSHSTNQILPDSWRSRQRYKSSHLPKKAFAPRGSLEMYDISSQYREGIEALTRSKALMTCSTHLFV